MANKDKNLIKSGMPETMFSESTAERVRYKLQDDISELHFAIMDLRKAGVPLETIEEVKSINRESIKAQLNKDKEAYFKNMRFVPTGIRKQVNREFAEMENTILPLVDELVRRRKAIPFSYTLDNKESYKTMESCVKIDDKELEDYVRKAGTTQILPEFREYYETLSDFCKAFTKLQEEAKRLQIVQPDRNLVLDLMDFSKFSNEDITGALTAQIPNMSITPEKMFELIRSNRIRKE